MPDAAATTVSVDGHRIKLTNLDKVLYPATGTTKAEVIDYYSRVAKPLIAHAWNRPATRKRWVHGVGTDEHPGQMFFQKNLDAGTPSWVMRRSIEHSDHDNVYPLVNDASTLVWLAQIAALELHVPQWQFGRAGARKNPDRLVLDLDPGEGTGLAECAEVARFARVILTDMGLDPHPVTSGSKGIHLYAAVDGSQTADQVSAVAHELARVLEADHPDLVVSDMKKSLRTGRVLVDWSQNNGNKTTIAPYSLRGRERPWVAAPRTWDELESADLRQLDHTEVLGRLQTGGDPLATLAAGHLASLEPTRERMATFETSPEARDRLQKYRSMRDGSKTPEPVPSAAPAPSAGFSFVIQEHHARRLHYDFRLEHDGVLVSWALPKGVPTDGKQNHLAVQTEDHPLEYGTFEGSIPSGEYGGGEVTIWDSGTYELEKWREGREVIATLHGEKHGSHRYALIHTGSRGGATGGENNWLIHLMADAAGQGHDERAVSGGASSDGPNSIGPGGDRPGSDGPNSTGPGSDQPGSDGPNSTGPGSDGPGSDGAADASGSATSATIPDAPAPSPGRPRVGKPVGKTVVGTSRPSRERTIVPMLASPGAVVELAETAEWAFEMKWDGIRAIAYLESGGVRLVSRNGNDLTAAYPDLAGIPEALADGSAILDGEIVALNRSGRPDFGLLQQRMNLSRPAEIAAAAKATPVQFMVFDLLEHDGRSVVSETYDRRRAMLERAVTPAGRVQVPPAFDGDARAAIAASLELGLEGILAKRRDSTYSVGQRSKSWIKIKNLFAQEVVIGGWRTGKGRREGEVGSLLMGIPDGDALRYVGRVGTGFTDRQLDDVAALLRPMEQQTCPFRDISRADAADAHWVAPTFVGEVEFAEWTGPGRLRQPSWRGWRTDKKPSDVVREAQ